MTTFDIGIGKTRVAEGLNELSKIDLMATMTHHINRTAHLLTLMKKDDNAFNARDFEGMSAIHPPKKIARVIGSAEPIRGQAVNAAAMKEMVRIFPEVNVHNDPSEIEAWSAFMEKRAPDSDAETCAFFAEHLGRLSKAREASKPFAFGELEAYVSCGGKA